MQDTGEHNIVVCCDGTWCGDETGTRTNIKILADAFASEDLSNPVDTIDGKPKYNSKTNTHVCYFNGVGTSGAEGKELPGLLGGFFDLLVYCASGAVATDLPERCKEAYRFIAEHYKGPKESRVWLFGLSRGAYTVRAVAGMVNNCGIVRADWPGVDAGGLDDLAADQDLNVDKDVDTQQHSPLDRLVQRVWETYSSDEDGCRPWDPQSKKFRKDTNKVWPAGPKPPIVFMGLLDTVGATGLPRIDNLNMTPLTYEYRPFRDFVVSSEVENVFQACSTHDRLAPFESCPVRRRDQKPEDPAESGGQSQEPSPSYPGVELHTEEVWYPGAHYDLGRQRFVVSNQPFTHLINKLLNPFRTNVNYTPELADYPLLGYELYGTLDPPASTAPADYPPCIVGKVCCIAPNMLPAPSKRQVWKRLVQGQPDLSKFRSGGFIDRIRTEAQQRGVLRTGVKVMVETTSAVVSWGYTAFVSPKVVARGVRLVGAYLPLPAFQPAYDIDAETKILQPLAKFAGYVFTGKFTPCIILRDRCIPMPVDKHGFNIGEARFFPVPRDAGSFASYTPEGRQPNPWHMSKTYLSYQSRLAEWNRRQSARPHKAATAVQQLAKQQKQQQQQLVKARGVDQAVSSSKIREA